MHILRVRADYCSVGNCCSFLPLGSPPPSLRAKLPSLISCKSQPHLSDTLCFFQKVESSFKTPPHYPTPSLPLPQSNLFFSFLVSSRPNFLLHWSNLSAPRPTFQRLSFNVLLRHRQYFKTSSFLMIALKLSMSFSTHLYHIHKFVKCSTNPLAIYYDVSLSNLSRETGLHQWVFSCSSLYPPNKLRSHISVRSRKVSPNSNL